MFGIECRMNGCGIFWGITSSFMLWNWRKSPYVECWCQNLF